MAETEGSDFPIMQRDYPPGTLIEEHTLFVLQVKDDEGRWMGFLTPYEDRDALTRIQAHRLREFPEERRRVVRRVLQFVIDEVEGDGEGEISADALMARNEENTERLLKKDRQPAS